jgi:hypothetical protein
MRRLTILIFFIVIQCHVVFCQKKKLPKGLQYGIIKDFDVTGKIKDKSSNLNLDSVAVILELMQLTLTDLSKSCDEIFNYNERFNKDSTWLHDTFPISKTLSNSEGKYEIKVYGEMYENTFHYRKTILIYSGGRYPSFGYLRIVFRTKGYEEQSLVVSKECFSDFENVFLKPK